MSKQLLGTFSTIVLIYIYIPGLGKNPVFLKKTKKPGFFGFFGFFGFLGFFGFFGFFS